MTPASSLTKARAAKHILSVKSTDERFFAARLDVSNANGAKILFRLKEMPETCRNTYLRAMRGKSKSAAIKAFCQMCFDWDKYRSEIPECTDPACPLFPYRPYVKK